MKKRDSFEQFEASELFCPKCQAAMPVRKRLLLTLLDGDKYDYVCVRCGSPVGSKFDPTAEKVRLIRN